MYGFFGILVKLKLKLKTPIFSSAAMRAPNLDMCMCIMLMLWKLVTCNTCKETTHLQKFTQNVTQAEGT